MQADLRKTVSQYSAPLSNSEQKAIGLRLLELLPINSIDLIPLSKQHTAEELRKIFPASRVIACDFYIQGAESQQYLGFGFGFPNHDILNIDHHADFEQMRRPVSSGNLAIQFVETHGVASADSRVVISHTDCDSIISSLIVRGLLPNKAIFGEAVLAADHSGVEEPISELLQAIDVKRDLNFSARNLALLLMGEPLDDSAQVILDKRLQARKETENAIRNGNAVKQNGDLVVVQLIDNMRNEIMPAFFPQASVILSFEKGKRDGLWVIRLRLGNAAPEGFTLFSLPLEKLDPNFGGRWNAGSNERGGGTTEPLDRYIEQFNIALAESLGKFR